MVENIGERWPEWAMGNKDLIKGTIQEKRKSNSINHITCMHCNRRFAGPELSNGTLLCPACDSSNLITEV